jgi:hypothetical protein
MNVDLYYLDKRDSDLTNDWKYFRVTAIEQMHIEVCEVEFPTLTDKGVATDHAWIVGLASAYDIKGKHLKSLGIDQDRAIIIGMVVRP